MNGVYVDEKAGDSKQIALYDRYILEIILDINIWNIADKYGHMPYLFFYYILLIF